MIALGVSLEAMQIDTDVTFCSKNQWNFAIKRKKGEKVHTAFSDMIANQYLANLILDFFINASGLKISKPPMIFNMNGRLAIYFFSFWTGSKNT